MYTLIAQLYLVQFCRKQWRAHTVIVTLSAIYNNLSSAYCYKMATQRWRKLQADVEIIL